MLHPNYNYNAAYLKSFDTLELAFYHYNTFLVYVYKNSTYNVL